jgi:CMP-N-acetylneuraminic acid synthetase
VSCICIIPARGGSKGIPHKNLSTVGGRTLINRAVQTVLESEVAQHVYVSTDSIDIAAEASSSGAQVIERPAELATDDATSESVLLHGLSTLGIHQGSLLFVQVTSPLLLADDIRRLCELHEQYDSAFTASLSHRFLWEIHPDGSASGINHDPTRRLRRQDIGNQQAQENGAAYLMDLEQFLQYEHRFFGKIGVSLMPALRSIEIDTEEDLIMANLLDHGIRQ